MIARSETLQGLRALVVEDEALLAEELVQRLSRLGMTVESAASSEQAIASAATLPPDLVFMDIRIKGEMDGIETAHALQSRLSVPIVYVTAHTDRATLTRASETGFFGYLVKPLQERDLIITAELAVRRHSVLQRTEHVVSPFSEAVASLADAMVITDASGCVAYLNPAAERLSRWTCAEAQGQPIDTVLPFVHSVATRSRVSPIEQTLAACLPVRFDTQPLVLTRRDGEAVPVDGSTAPIADGAVLLGAAMVLRDAGPRLLLAADERAVRASMDDDDRFEALERLAKGLATDFSGYLSVISGCVAKSLGDPALTDATRQWLENAADAAASAGALIGELSAFARTRDLCLSVVDVEEVVQDVAETFRPLLGGHLEIMVVSRVSNLRVEADRRQLEVALVDLLLNTRHLLTNSGVVWFVISEASTYELEDDREQLHRYAVLSISGDHQVPAQTSGHRAFEPYVEANDRGTSTGMALAAMYGTIRQLGGFIDVDTDQSGGKIFTLRLPLVNGPSTMSGALGRPH